MRPGMLGRWTAAMIAAAALAAAPGVAEEEKTMELKRLTPILFVEAIEPSLPFWTERLGFVKTAEVPQGDRLGFVILTRDGLEVMLQSRDSLAEDLPQLAAEAARSFLYLEIDDLAAFEERLQGIEIVVPRRTMPYGATEVVVREPGGHLVILAQFAARD